jgi:hypothetical protein
MKAPATVLGDLMKQVRALLYTALPDRAWFTQQERVKATLTLPAKWLDDRKVELPAERYQKLLEGVLATIKAKGRKADQLGRFPCIYLHSCVESHMRHHGEEYYYEGKGIRNRVKIFMTAVERAQVGADETVPILAKVHTEVAAAVSAGRRKPKSKAIAGPVQPDFFGGQGDGDIAKVREETGLTAPNCEKSPDRPGRQKPAA